MRLETRFVKYIRPDVAKIAPGQRFDQAIQDHIENSKVVLAVIGRRWLETDEAGIKRLDDPEDYVRKELTIGLARKERVIPVLVEDAQDLRSELLPEPLKELALCQRLRVSHERFRSDTEQVIKAVEFKLKKA